MSAWPFLVATAVLVCGYLRWGRERPVVGGCLLSLATLAAVWGLLRDSRPIDEPGKVADQAVRPVPVGPIEHPRLTGEGAVAPRPQLPREQPHGGFVGSASCRDCHQKQFGTWHDSYHRTMTQVLRPGIAVGDFSVGRLTNHASGLVVELSHTTNALSFARVNEDSGRVGIPQQLILATGSHHMQAYWYSAGLGDALGLMPFVYLREEGRWIPREAAFVLPPGGNFGHEIGRWNTVCFRCHTTGGESRQLDAMALHETRVAEHGISCEACHGAGAAHVEFRKANRSLGSGGEDPIANPAAMGARDSIDMCGNCHRAVVFDSSAPGGSTARVRMAPDDPGYRQFLASTEADGQAGVARKFRRDLDLSFWSDGMVRVSGRESTAVEDSACHVKGGMTCVNCHSMHRGGRDERPREAWADDQLAPIADGDAACLKCHDPGAFATRKHTHHDLDSSGSRCYNCHMPHTSFGLLKASRSHLVSSPSARETVRHRRQNACNICHLDKSLAWTAQNLAEWFGQPQPELGADQRRYPAVVLAALTGDAAERALAAWYLGWLPAVETSGGDWAAAVLAVLMADDYNAVRYVAGRSLRRWPGFTNVEFDFVAPVERRNQFVAAVRSKWLARPTAREIVSAAELERLLRGRDQSPVYLPE